MMQRLNQVNADVENRWKLLARLHLTAQNVQNEGDDQR